MIQPLGTKVLITPEKTAEKKTDSGIILTTVQEVYGKAKVEAVSPDIESKLKPGDSVLFDINAGVPIEEKYLLIEEKNIVAKL
jgi:co-chaperonin GroES (HSP10)